MKSVKNSSRVGVVKDSPRAEPSRSPNVAEAQRESTEIRPISTPVTDQ